MAPRPRNVTRTVDTAEQGIAAIRQHRDAWKNDRLSQASALDQLLRGDPGANPYTMPTGSPSARYQGYLDSALPSNYPVSYGRTDDGDYWGYQTQGLGTAALRGQAEMYRHQDEGLANELQLLANQRLGEMDDYYGTNVYGADEINPLVQSQHMPSPGSPSEIKAAQDLATMQSSTQGLDYRNGGWYSPTSGELVATGASEDSPWSPVHGRPQGPSRVSLYPGGPTIDTAPYELAGQLDQSLMGQLQGANETNASSQRGLDTMHGYNKELDKWLQQNADPYLQAGDFAEEVLNTPGQEYGLRAAAAMGISPELAYGMFPEEDNLGYFEDQRNLESERQTGMPYDEFQSALGQIDADTKDATTAQDQAQIDAWSNDVMQTYGVPGQAVADEMNMTPEQVNSLLNSDQFLNAADALDKAIGETGLPKETLANIINQTPDQGVKQLLQSLYNGYLTVPTD